LKKSRIGGKIDKPEAKTKYARKGGKEEIYGIVFPERRTRGGNMGPVPDI
jgi:hypothetical protein